MPVAKVMSLKKEVHIPQMVVRYEWESKTKRNELFRANRYTIIVNLSRKKFYTFKTTYKEGTTYNEEKMGKATNDYCCNTFYVELKNKTSYEQLLKGLKMSNFEEII